MSIVLMVLKPASAQHSNTDTAARDQARMNFVEEQRMMLSEQQASKRPKQANDKKTKTKIAAVNKKISSMKENDKNKSKFTYRRYRGWQGCLKSIEVSVSCAPSASNTYRTSE